MWFLLSIKKRSIVPRQALKINLICCPNYWGAHKMLPPKYRAAAFYSGMAMAISLAQE
jgi:hypothetical protein